MVHRFLTRGEGTNMSTKVSPTLIGAFVVGALALLIVAVIAFVLGAAISQKPKNSSFTSTFGQRLAHRTPVKIKASRSGPSRISSWKKKTSLAAKYTKIQSLLRST